MQQPYRARLFGTAFALSLAVAVPLCAVSGSAVVRAMSSNDGTTGSTTPPAASSDGKPAADADAKTLLQQAKQKAAEARQQAQSKAEDAKQKVAAAQARAKARQDTAKTDTTTKLGAAKQRVCQSHEQEIDDIMERIGKRGDNHLQLIDVVSERVQQFYADKKLSVDNYDGLLAAVTTARTAANAAVGSTDSIGAEFKCSAADPNGTAASFQDLVTARNDAIKAYRDAVKQMVGAVKAADKAQTAAAGPAAGGLTTVTERQR